MPATPTANPAAGATDDFYYDGVGNRTKAQLKSADATTYLHNAVNEYTKETTAESEKERKDAKAQGRQERNSPFAAWRLGGLALSALIAERLPAAWRAPNSAGSVRHGLPGFFVALRMTPLRGGGGE